MTALNPTEVMVLLASSTDGMLYEAMHDPTHRLRATISEGLLASILANPAHAVGAFARGALWSWCTNNAPGFLEIEQGLRGV